MRPGGQILEKATTLVLRSPNVVGFNGHGGERMHQSTIEWKVELGSSKYSFREGVQVVG